MSRPPRNDRQRLATKLEHGRWIQVAAHVRAHAHEIEGAYEHNQVPDFRDRYGRLFKFPECDGTLCELAGETIATPLAMYVMNEPKKRPSRGSEPRRVRLVGYAAPEVAERVTRIAAARGLTESQVVAWACEVLVTGLETS